MNQIPYINLKLQHKELKRELLAAVGRVLDNSNFILGDEVNKFETTLASYCAAKYAVGVNSGTDALFLSLKACGIGPGDEVITAPNSFLATVSVIVAAGAKPVFVDTGADLNINPDLIEEKVTNKTRAIIPVHLTGRPAAMGPILRIARKYGLHVIEDAAQAIGAEYKGQKVGTFGATGCFSLHPLKTLNACGDAGAITTSNQRLCRTLMQMRNIGLKNRDEADIWGYNSRLDTVQAAVLLVKFKYLDAWTEERRKKARYYLEHLRGIVVLPVERKYEKCVYHTFVIQAEQRDKLQSYLEQQGIGTRIHYPIPLHLQKACRPFKFKKGDFPVCEKQAEMILSLPMYHGLTEEQQALIVKKIRNFYGN